VGPRAGLDERKISSLPGFDPGPSSPVVSRNTDRATGPTPTIVQKYKTPSLSAQFCVLRKCTHGDVL